ncbi:PQQ-dependent sugar dehydrogenase [Balneatrix alpica]|uniref:PQQ-dependent sugar dehydrogenase n=1 Tax=Balneatrix alpica TaxID=75684 RepID=A0ABV5Z9D9_9GAMM|nr:PQQ-dependent sugar dehydrogenase [Balneatrix alpica]
MSGLRPVLGAALVVTSLALSLVISSPLAAETPPDRPLAHGKVISQGNSGGQDFVVEQLLDNLGTPWGLALIDPEQLLVSSREGRLQRINLSNLSVENISGLAEVWHQGQGGLLDIAPAPDFASSAWLYFTYAKPLPQGAATTLARAKLAGKQLQDWQDLLVSNSHSNNGQHFGSRIAFDESGYVYFSVGDRGERPWAQDLSQHAGSILRLRLDGSIPPDNPFSQTPEAEAALWSIGHRNPQGLSYDPVYQRLWAIEHGPRGGDELNLIQAGHNYGWPEVSFGKEYWGPIQVGSGTSAPGFTDPLKVYTPSIAPSSLRLYQGTAFPHWHGSLLAGALAMTHLNRISLDQAGKPSGEERLLENLGERLRSLEISPQGWLYIGTDSGKLLRVRPQP